jgi:hypothetical protein
MRAVLAVTLVGLAWLLATAVIAVSRQMRCLIGSCEAACHNLWCDPSVNPLLLGWARITGTCGLWATLSGVRISDTEQRLLESFAMSAQPESMAVRITNMLQDRLELTLLAERKGVDLAALEPRIPDALCLRRCWHCAKALRRLATQHKCRRRWRYVRDAIEQAWRERDARTPATLKEVYGTSPRQTPLMDSGWKLGRGAKALREELVRSTRQVVGRSGVVYVPAVAVVGSSLERMTRYSVSRMALAELSLWYATMPQVDAVANAVAIELQREHAMRELHARQVEEIRLRVENARTSVTVSAWRHEPSRLPRSKARDPEEFISYEPPGRRRELGSLDEPVRSTTAIGHPVWRMPPVVAWVDGERFTASFSGTTQELVVLEAPTTLENGETIMRRIYALPLGNDRYQVVPVPCVAALGSYEILTSHDLHECIQRGYRSVGKEVELEYSPEPPLRALRQRDIPNPYMECVCVSLSQPQARALRTYLTGRLRPATRASRPYGPVIYWIDRKGSRSFPPDTRAPYDRLVKIVFQRRYGEDSSVTEVVMGNRIDLAGGERPSPFEVVAVFARNSSLIGLYVVVAEDQEVDDV